MSDIKSNSNFLGVERRAESWPLGQDDNRSGATKKLSPKAGKSEADYNPRVEPKRKNRKHTLDFQLRIINEVLAAPRGEVSAIIRREGLYWSQVQGWINKYQKNGVDGLTGATKKNATKVRANERKELEKLKRENIKLKKQLETAKLINEIQKKIAEILSEEDNTGSES